MGDKCYHVIFTGALVPGMERKAVMSNLVLEVGLSEEKAKNLLTQQQVLLKRYETEPDAKRLADKFQRAGLHCVVDDRRGGNGGSSGDSLLMSIFAKLGHSQLKK